MKCPKCSYTSFDYLQECKKCGEILDGSRKSLNLRVGVPTIFAEIGNRNEEQSGLDTPPTETTFVDTQDEQLESGLLLGNEFSAPTENNLVAPPEADLNLENELELSGLGSMNTMESRSESEFEMDQQENIVLDDLELSPAFSDNTEPKSELIKNESADLDGSGLDLFPESAESEIKPADQLEDDIAFELSMNDSEIDLGLTENLTSEPETVQKNVLDDGTIELELDMDDDESLDDLLKDLEKKD